MNVTIFACVLFVLNQENNGINKIKHVPPLTVIIFFKSYIRLNISEKQENLQKISLCLITQNHNFFTLNSKLNIS